jgi:pimeloyl-ACP methyl ester carboxylesterase
MRTRTERHSAKARSETLLVLLPPSLSSIDDFYQHGMVDAVRQRALPVDLLLADVTAQHVVERSAVAQLQAHVVQPAQALGYRQIWLAGISMGAFSALHYAAEHSAPLAGLYLLAPYPGTGDVLAEIRGAGGAAAWHQRQPTSTQDERQWWHWLCRTSAAGHWPTPVYFGTGHADRFLGGQTLLSDLLPPERTCTLPGRHDWPTWTALWNHWLDHGPLAKSGEAPPTIQQANSD